jgi:nucleoporin p58/p45
MQVESLHQQIEAMRIAFIADRRRRGDDTNPFLEADRREVAKREVAAKRVHPSLNGPMTPLTTHTPGVNGNAQVQTPFGAGAVQNTPSSAPFFGAQGTPSLFSPASALVQFTPSTVASSGLGATSFSMFGASTPSSNIFGGLFSAFFAKSD